MCASASSLAFLSQTAPQSLPLLLNPAFDWYERVRPSAAHRSSLYFRPGEDRLSFAAKRKLLMFLRSIATPQAFSLVLHGHADASGTDEYAAVLAMERARATARFLANFPGFAPPCHIGVWGARHATGGGGEAARDRRVEIWLIPADTLEAADSGA